MCDFRILSQNNNGYVVYCPDCKAIQLAFGTTLIKVCVQHFSELAEIVSMECNYRGGSDDLCTKNITIPIDEGITFCLTLTELLQLEQLVSESSAMYETYSILEQV